MDALRNDQERQIMLNLCRVADQVSTNKLLTKFKRLSLPNPEIDVRVISELLFQDF